MPHQVHELSVERTIDALYDAAVGHEDWGLALQQLATLFNAGFADLCSWTHDRQHVSGLAHGLDRDDYDGVLLGFWFNRNVWSRKKPARIPGEVLSTRSMVPREDLRRSEMYRAYLESRGLHEGLRFTLWADQTGLGDVSLLRPWSGGAFGPAEVALGRMIIPHLQRATTITRRLREADFRLDGASGGAAAGDMAAIAFDRGGRPFWFNTTARQMVERGMPLRLVSGQLRAATQAATAALAAAVARAAAGHQGGAVMLPRSDAQGSVNAIVVALSHRDDWSLPVPPAAMIYLRAPDPQAPDAEALRALFGLTAAEGELARDLQGGATIAEVAARTGRSQNTLRTHLARLLQKTGTTRQIELVRLLDRSSGLDVTPRPGPEKRAGDPLAPPPRRRSAAPEQ
jgi:DNA-binding CsgD family transcriptional regulator